MAALAMGWGAAARAETETVDGVEWRYEVGDGEFATVTGANPAEGDLMIPVKLGRHPVTSIEDEAFRYCSGLTRVTIGDSVTSIGYGAFSGCASALYDTNSIPGVRLVDGWAVGKQSPSGDLDLAGIRGIGSSAFSGCSGLTGVAIGDSVTSIGDYAFSGCSGLVSFSVASGNPQYSAANGLLLNKDGTTVVCGVNGDVTIPDSVTSIGDSAFYDYSGLTSVTIPDNVTSIGNYAFSWCSGLTSVTIGDSVTNIGYSAFDGCSGLASVSIGVGVTSIGYDAFSGCSGLTSVTIPDSVTIIRDGAFSGCSSLKELRVPKAWEGTSMLDGVWGLQGKPEGCEITYYESGKSGEAVAVPNEWMDAYAAEILAENEGDYAAAAKAEAANGMAVWECYLAGLSTTNAAAAFTVKSIEFVDGKPVVKWEPDLNEGGTKEERVYTVEGAETPGGAWGATNAASRFFRVRVGMP